MQSRKPYPTELHDAKWQILTPLIPAATPGGRPEEDPPREIVNALLSGIRTGWAWRCVPNDVPPWGSVYHSCWPWRRDGIRQRMNAVLRGALRVLEGRHRQPSAGMRDSQSVQTTERGGDHGFDSAKQVNGCKRHILVETLGLLIAVVGTAATVPDRDGATQRWGILRHWFPRLRCLGAEGAYAGGLETWGAWLRGYRKVRWEMVKRADQVNGFVVLPQRGSIARTFGWFGKYRRLSKAYEYLTATSEAMM